MWRFLAQRLASAAFTFLGITIVVFALIRAVPGDPVLLHVGAMGRSVPPEIIEGLRKEHRLDRPVVVQYGHWLQRAVRLDLGRSFVDGSEVSSRLLSRLPRTVLLSGAALLLALAIGFPIGLWSAWNRGSSSERAVGSALLLLYSVPLFWGGLLLIDLFVVRLGWLPLSAESDDGQAVWLRQMVLPLAALTYGQIAIFGRFARAAALDQVTQPFVAAAMARGASPLRIVGKHVFRATLVPLAGLLSATVPFLISGSVIVETMFRWNGIGQLYFSSVLARDYPTVMGVTVFTAVAVLLAGIVADVATAAADPRLRPRSAE